MAQLNQNVDNLTINVNATGQLEVETGGVTRTQLAAVGQQVSASSGTFGTTNHSMTPVTNLSVTLTTTGRPVMLMLISDGNGSGIDPAFVGSDGSAGSNFVMFGAFFRGSTQIAYHEIATLVNNESITVPSSSFVHLDVVAAGTYTYTFQIELLTSGTAKCYYSKLVAYEL